MELMGCTGLAVPGEVMQHVVRVESSRNPYAIGVVGGRLVREPRGLQEAVATAKMLEQKGYNFSLGLGQVNRYNLAKYGLTSYEMAFEKCPNLVAASRILAECHSRSGANWGKSFSCYYSGNFETGFKHGYVQKIYASIRQSAAGADNVEPIGVIPNQPIRVGVRNPLRQAAAELADAIISRRVQGMAQAPQMSSQRAAPLENPSPLVSANSPTPVTQAEPSDLYIIKATSQGRGVAVPAVAPSQAVTLSAGPPPAEPIDPQLQRQVPVDSAFVF
ncbi:lytic transglycosylase domain-containing protein [Xanthomonas nasturtii]|uniref:lytic transglycosylase domain-containing protein n=1 Tax=Xanthomonas nasturtii TaxID=1843581 RepID=UPI002B23D8AE|nr:lytic transglycosylase domain-containing protein [Xanthomonas nasturtii]MEA9580016.1 lytic transglycosylase domain-containing protein [Xanthomonas nasturtii]